MNQEIHILVVDDLEEARFVLNSVLRKSEFKGKYTLASSGEEAWSLLQENPDKYTVALIDRMMPGMNGLSLLKLMKADSRFKGIQVIFQTAMAATPDIIEGLAAGAFYYVTKPLPEAIILLAIIRAAIDDSQRTSFFQVEKDEAISVIQRPNGFRLSFRTKNDAKLASSFTARVCPDPGKTLMGISELTLNAVEHSLARIGYLEKKELLLSNALEQEIEKRLALPENEHKKASLIFFKGKKSIKIIIMDGGIGFDWTRFLTFEPERVRDPNGRGIAMAKMMSFDALEYLGNGNTVVATINL
ncbi:MAG: response regulator [Candidatus Falkowbacteria bacterium]|nr:response regulator [Candidatus Falkowbacteria bacterium]